MSPGNLNLKRSVRTAADIHDFFSGTDVQAIVFRDPPIIDEAVLPGGLLVARNERHIADLDSLWSREECHGEGVAFDR